MKIDSDEILFQNSLRYHINRFIFDNGFAPDTLTLSKLTDKSIESVKSALRALHDTHGLVLHPNATDIWIAHPFALFPTLFWVTAGEKRWWGNCAWCSLGIASFVDGDCEIHTKLEGQKESVIVHIQDGQVLEKDLVVHFPKPVREAWNNVVHFCASTLVFENESHVDAWCARHNVTKGRVVPVEQTWELSKRWYGYYLDPNWKPKTPEMADQIFEAVGLTENYWKLT